MNFIFSAKRVKSVQLRVVFECPTSKLWRCPFYGSIQLGRFYCMCMCVWGLYGLGANLKPVPGPACGQRRAGKCQRILLTGRDDKKMYFQTGRAGEREKNSQTGRSGKRKMSFPMAGPGRTTIKGKRIILWVSQGREKKDQRRSIKKCYILFRLQQM